MAVVMRLKRMGAKNKPFYRIVVADSRSARDGKFVEELGYYNPKKTDEKTVVKADRIKYWLGQGVKPTKTVRSILKKHGIL